LPAAQSAGQKAQEDAQLGQGSIFDFGEEADAGAHATQAHHRPPISAEEFERAELLAMEKETLGTYLSEHPLTEVRGALRARVDCGLADLAGKQEGAWLTVGGIVTECKKIRTKSGSQMMFATLDDVEGQVELLVFKADQAESAAVIAPDAIVVVRGRLDHKDRGETKLVVQEAARFEPDAAEIAAAPAVAATHTGPFEVPVDAGMLSDSLLEELKSVLEHHKGDTEVHLAVRNGSGATTVLQCGEGFRVRPSGRLQSELDHVLGSAALAA
jgi:DNA polymerase III subunit alpha